MITDTGDDIRAIEAIVRRQFDSLNWREGTSAEWRAFAADFAPEASLYAAARPARPQSVGGFVDRMKGLAKGPLRSFAEAALGIDIRVFGNVAVAIAGCAMTENGDLASRGVEMMLLVKSEGRWQIASQAWDTERSSLPLPDDLTGAAGLRGNSATDGSTCC